MTSVRSGVKANPSQTVPQNSSNQTSPVTHYQCEHLLTYQSSFKLRNVKKIPHEVYQKIASLEKQNRLFVQDIIVHVDNTSVKLLDVESFEVVDSFKYEKDQLISVFDITAKFDTVNSLLVLVVSEKGIKKENTCPDVHVFQCAQRQFTAQIITKDIKAALIDYRNLLKQWKKISNKNRDDISGSFVSQRESVLEENRSFIESIPPEPPKFSPPEVTNVFKNI